MFKTHTTNTATLKASQAPFETTSQIQFNTLANEVRVMKRLMGCGMVTPRLRSKSDRLAAALQIIAHLSEMVRILQSEHHTTGDTIGIPSEIQDVTTYIEEFTEADTEGESFNLSEVSIAARLCY